MERSSDGKLGSVLKPIFLIVLLAAVIGGAWYFNIQEALKMALNWIATLGPWGPIIFIILYILATILCIPGSLLTLGAGAIFGMLWGSICVSIGATLGAAVAFLIGRYLARGWAKKRIEDNPKFKAISQAVAKEGWKIVLLTRLSPVFPFNLLNYAFGITQVSFKDYFFLTWVGITPGTVLYVYLGSLAGGLVKLGIEGRPPTLAQAAFYAAGLIATVIVAVYVTRIARKALKQSVL